VNGKPVETPDAFSCALGERLVAIIGNEQGVLAVLAEGAVGVLEDLPALSASY
jgi:hypothetical protein